MGKIDRPIDAVLDQYPEQPENFLGEISLEIAGIFNPLVKIGNILRQRLSGSEKKQRASAVFNAFNDELLRLQNQIDQKTIEARLDSPEFQDALMLAIEEAWRTSNEVRVQRLAAVLANGVATEVDVPSGEDLSSFVREVAYLDDGDIQMLQVMGYVYQPAIRNRPDLSDPNEFTLLIAGFLRRTDELKISRDDVYSRCTRLSGFGLAREVPRSDTRMSPSDHCFRPTQRGLRLLRLLGQAGSYHFLERGGSIMAVIVTPSSSPEVLACTFSFHGSQSLSYGDC